MVDLRQTQEYSKYIQALGWDVILSDNEGSPHIFVKKLPLLGNIAKLQRPSNVNFKQINHLINKYKISVLYIEPSIKIKFVPSVFKSARSAFLPSKTIHLDLRKTEEQLLKEMKPKTRYNIKLAQKRGVIVKESKDINDFINLWKSSARRRLALPQDKEINALWSAFGKKAHLLFAYHPNSHNTPIAGVLVARSSDTAFYMYAGSSSEGKKLFTPTLVTWEAITLAKKLHCKTFDFEGIYDERYSSTIPWRGFTKFKEGFGGKVIEFPKTLVFHKNPFFKLLNI